MKAAIKKMSAAKMPNIPRDEAQINEDIAKMMEQVDANQDGKIEW